VTAELARGVDRFLQSLRHERQLSPLTAASYSRDLAALLDYCRDEALSGGRSSTSSTCATLPRAVTGADSLRAACSGGCRPCARSAIS
jgi:site-specific recombinase XerC